MLLHYNTGNISRGPKSSLLQDGVHDERGISKWRLRKKKGKKERVRSSFSRDKMNCTEKVRFARNTSVRVFLKKSGEIIRQHSDVLDVNENKGILKKVRRTKRMNTFRRHVKEVRLQLKKEKSIKEVEEGVKLIQFLDSLTRPVV